MIFDNSCQKYDCNVDYVARTVVLYKLHIIHAILHNIRKQIIFKHDNGCGSSVHVFV